MHSPIFSLDIQYAIAQKCHMLGLINKDLLGFPGGAVVKNPPANAGDTGWSPGLGRYHMPQSN